MFNRLRRSRRLFILLAVVGPGLITSNADNDAGGIATYAQAGAEFRFKMLWLLVVVTICLIVVNEMSARMGVVTGKGLADLIRERFGVRSTTFAMALLLVANAFTTVAEFIRRNVFTVNLDASRDEVAAMMSKYNLMALPVVDDENRLRGIITVDDALESVLPEGVKRRLPKLVG